MDTHGCYTIQKYVFDDGFLSRSVDATYIFHLEGNGRFSTIEKYLDTYHPTHIVYVFIDKGYKKCKKPLVKQTSTHDIVYGYTQIFKHSQANNYSNVLILEDDFIFSPDVLKIEHTNEINRFLIDHKHTEFVYNLGVVPTLVFPYTISTYRVIAGGGLHASVYSYKAQTTFINNIKDIGSPEGFLMWGNNSIKWYMYYKPLCYQTFPNTENSKNYIFGQIDQLSFTMFGLDKQAEPGTSIRYIVAKLLSFLIFIVFVVCIIKLLYYFKFIKEFTSYKSRRMKRF